MLTVTNLEQTIQDKKILQSISISVTKKEVTVFLGPNGAGKTTLLKSIIGLLPTPKASETKNKILLEKETINTWPVSKRVARGLVYLPQQTSLFRQLSVLDNLLLVYDHHPYWRDKSKKIFIEEISLWFEKTGLTCPFSQKAHSLSGGQKRKLEVIRTILSRPKIAMFDEPFAGVDPKSIYEIKEIFSHMAHNESIAVVVSDHNVDQLLSIANKVYVIIAGQVVTSGSIKDILDDTKTKDAYFGNQFYSEISQKFLG